LILAIAALIVAPILLLCGMLGSAFVARGQFSSHPEAFRCKLRSVTTASNGSPQWSRTGHARWVHDTLVVASGLWRIKIQPFGVHFAEGTVGTAAAGDVSGLGPKPALVLLQLDDDTRVILAAPAAARALVCGPYLVAQVTADVGRNTDNPFGTSR
jgi:hypothetical protein